MKLTRKENLRKTLRGEAPRWVPFALNFAQWFQHHRTFGSLPPELQNCEDYVDAMKALDCDIFSRNLDGGFRERNTQVEVVKEITPGATGPRIEQLWTTPHGTLREVCQHQSALSTSYEVEYPVKDWETDGKAFRYLLEQVEYSWDEKAFHAINDKIGDDGILNVRIGSSPLKMLHQNFGLDGACLFLLDYPDEAKEICALYWSKIRPVWEQIAAHPDVEATIIMDNVDTPFYPPSLAREFWAPYVAEAGEMMRAHGKYLFVHACGQLAALNELFAQTRVSGLEGIAHPPLGDWTAEQAQACHSDFIFIGGFSACEQEHATDAQVERFYAEYLPTASKTRFIFSSSCQTAINTPWSRLVQVREICRAWGGRPEDV